jgi:NDP-sugar pyrophosphorylase family protein
MTATAFLLCGGLGTRLRGVTERPKALLSVAGWPFLRYHIEQLRGGPIDRIAFLTGYRGDEVESEFTTPDTPSGDAALAPGEANRGPAPRRLFLREPNPLGTGGALARAHGLAAEWNWIANGDSFVDVRARAVLAAAAPGAGLVVCVRAADRSEYGGVEISEAGLIDGFREKGEVGPGWINAGVYVLPRDMLLELCRPPEAEETPSSLERDVFPRWAAEGRLRAFRAHAFFRDIGTPDRLAAAQEEFGAIRRRLEEERSR